MKYCCLTLLLLLGLADAARPFCGFYVARAGAELFNNKSQVILVRSDRHTVLTMGNDFQGDVREFAMVVPVPTVLQREQIRIAEQSIFDYLDAYSGPRLVEYHDENPCQPRLLYDNVPTATAAGAGFSRRAVAQAERARDLGVRIEATYTVGEYNILILSAQQASGLKTWLTENGYSIPAQAEEVLDPYIRSNLKFFVVKVNLGEMTRQGYTKLRPIQIEYDSDKFMLPIRLGMANSKGVQDLIIYALSPRGRIETVNYPTRSIPTDMDIPEDIQPRFGEFYAALFNRAWQDAGKRSVMLEYSWDISSTNYQHCDPCNTTPPTFADLKKAGVFWVTQGQPAYYSTADYAGNVFITRLHARYSRDLYPEDFLFQETPGTGNFQGRYVMRHAATGDLSCDAGKAYLKALKERRMKERATLAMLTGWNTDASKFDNGPDTTRRDETPLVLPEDGNGGGSEPISLPSVRIQDPVLVTPGLLTWQRILFIGSALTLMLGLFAWKYRRLALRRA